MPYEDDKETSHIQDAPDRTASHKKNQPPPTIRCDINSRIPRALQPETQPCPSMGHH